MLKAMLTMLGAAGGFVEAVILYIVIDYFVHASPADVEPSVWSEYGVFIFAIVGALSGAALGWASHALFGKEPQIMFTRTTTHGLGSLSKREAIS